jgi:quercetin dioxygenase-like cupin family protein
MAAVVAIETPSYAFDDRNVRWCKLEGLEHVELAVFDVDEKRKLVDLLVKFAANQQIMLHRHLSLTNTWVVQGEHRLYEPTGAPKEVRPVGRYTSSPPGEPHREGGGVEGAVVFYSFRGDGVFLEWLDDNLNVVATTIGNLNETCHRAARSPFDFAALRSG